MSTTKWCSSCGGEFTDRSTCPDCDVELVEGPPPAVDDGGLERSVARSFADVRLGVTLLRGVAVLAVALWVVGVVASIIVTWRQVQPSTFADPPPTLATTLTVVLGTNSWGYLLVAVVAYAAALLLQYRDASDTLDVLTTEDAPS